MLHDGPRRRKHAHVRAMPSGQNNTLGNRTFGVRAGSQPLPGDVDVRVGFFMGLYARDEDQNYDRTLEGTRNIGRCGSASPPAVAMGPRSIPWRKAYKG
eukprot:2785853-Pyramimonas_sp.AAC.1